MLWGGRDAANKEPWHVPTSISGPHWVCPRFPCLHCLGSRLLFWELSEAGPGLHAPPRSKPLRFRHSGSPQRHRLGWACVLCPSQIQAAQVTRCLASEVAATYCLPRPCRLVFLVYNRRTFSGGCLLSRIPRSPLAKKPACSLIDNASLGPRLPPLALSALACLSLAGDGLVRSQLALFSPLFCERAWWCLRLGFFAG